MGRYYSGDIEGKFWFGVQSSDDASFFGGMENEPNYIEYHFDDGDMDDIEEGIAKCRDKLGPYKGKLDKFFKENLGYNDEMLVKAGFPKNEVRELLQWYARLELGEKIHASVKEYNVCDFDAEI